MPAIWLKKDAKGATWLCLVTIAATKRFLAEGVYLHGFASSYLECHHDFWNSGTHGGTFCTV